MNKSLIFPSIASVFTSDSPEARLSYACARAKEYEIRGEYEKARHALKPFWTSIGEQPKLSDLADHARALLLLRCGALSGYLGTTHQIPSAQEFAKDLLTASSLIYQKLDASLEYIETQYELILCYRRTGAPDEARIIAQTALDKLDHANIDTERSRLLRAEILIRAALVETYALRFEEGLRFLERAKPLVIKLRKHFLTARLHAATGSTLRYMAGRTMLAEAEQLRLNEQARKEFGLAITSFKLAGHDLYVAHIQNNLGMTLLTLKEFDAAHHHLDAALVILARLDDVGTTASVLESKARVYLGEGEFGQAQETALQAVKAYDEGGEEHAQLCEALVTYATALARNENFQDSYAAFLRATDAAAYAGHTDAAVNALLTLIEELHNVLPLAILNKIYQRADSLLVTIPSIELSNRLRAAAATVINATPLQSGSPDNGTWEISPLNTAFELPCDLPFDEAMCRFERNLLKTAIEASGNRLTMTANKLHITHQRLSAMLKTRHPALLALFKRRKKRHAHLISSDVRSTFRRSYHRAGK